MVVKATLMPGNDAKIAKILANYRAVTGVQPGKPPQAIATANAPADARPQVDVASRAIANYRAVVGSSARR